MSELDAIYALHDQAIADRDALLETNADLLSACEALGAFTRDLLKLVTHEQIKSARLTTRMLKVNDQAYNAIAKAKKQVQA